MPEAKRSEGGEPGQAILVVDDEAATRRLLGRLLQRDGWRVTLASGGQQALSTLRRESFDVVLTDLVMADLDGLELLTQAKRLDPSTEVVLMTGHASVDTAIDAIRRGAFHYVQKPLNPDEVRTLLRRAGEKRALGRRVRELESEQGARAVERIVGTSPAIERVRQLILQLRDSASSVLLTGESGTGKELVARAIHESSRRSSRKFLAVNCASFTDELLANELFGHERDAFTGARGAHAGLLESATGGTVFLDEAGDMPLSMQSKLLRVVQERELLRVGGTEPVIVDIRIIAATNKDLKQMVALGTFREDLYFRLNVIPIRVPTLAERREDIPLLAMHFLRRVRDRVGRPVEGFAPEALRVLSGYGYPGNVRELENIVERAATLATGARIEVGNLPPDLAGLDSHTFRYPTEPLSSLEQIERDYIAWVLERVGNNKSRAAQVLGIDRVSLYRKLRKRQVTE
jgi:DNA-binding NtrC family response regulator